MLNRVVAISLIFFTMSANFSKLFVYAGFEMNQKYIAGTLCVNKARPWLHCNGHCVLLKRIKAAEEKERNDERQAAKSRFQEAVHERPKTITFGMQLIGVLHTPYPYFVLSQRQAAIFHPPKTLV
jgi:hypothetical protein